MGTVQRLRPGLDEVSLIEAIDAFLAEIDNAGTRRVYGGTLKALVQEFGPDAPVGVVDTADGADRLVAWFHQRWDRHSPATFNRSLDTIKSAVGYWGQLSWVVGDPTRAIRRRRRPADRTRALSRAEIDRLLTRDAIALRERVLWRMLYETAARSSEVLALNVEDLDLPNRRAKVRRKGGASDIIVWQTETARLLPRLLRGDGPVRCSSPSGALVWPCPRPIWTNVQGGRGCPTAGRPSCSTPPPEVPRCTSSGTQPSATPPKLGRTPARSWRTPDTLRCRRWRGTLGCRRRG